MLPERRLPPFPSLGLFLLPKLYSLDGVGPRGPQSPDCGLSLESAARRTSSHTFEAVSLIEERPILIDNWSSQEKGKANCDNEQLCNKYFSAFLLLIALSFSRERRSSLREIEERDFFLSFTEARRSKPASLFLATPRRRRRATLFISFVDPDRHGKLN